MSSRNRKPGRNSEWYQAAADTARYQPVPGFHEADIREVIERADYDRYNATLQRVRSHPKNLLRLMNKRTTDTKESKRSSNNEARYASATRRAMRRR